jgi:hypothetical protein
MKNEPEFGRRGNAELELLTEHIRKHLKVLAA